MNLKAILYSPWSLLLVSMFMAAPATAQMGGPALVRVAVATVKDIAPVTMVPGTVISRHDARLSAEVEGRLTEVADVGTRVKEGEAVAQIEDTALRLRNTELKAEVTRAAARLRFLEREEDRFTRLAESNLAAATQLEQTRSDRDVALGDLEVARARLEQNEDRIDRTLIRAPYGGVVVERLMMRGERVVVGSMVVRLVDPADLEVIARAPLEYYAYVQRGQALELSTPGRTVPGTVRTVVAIGDRNTHQFELRLDLEGQPFPVGQTLRVSIPVSNTRQVLTVPRDALVLRSTGASVFVIADDDTARQVSVIPGIGQGDDIEISGEISAGERVVVRGNERLQPGQAVQIMDS
ncbi:MAG: efflux RND transporter periplasmic adaptor subunit [Gammaproteobacteria bacterium]|nr:efflux RND transporter periplasmic adaptor subunit [Gammaproteobacteria bacterium]MBT8055977.1 efflux RND transporter periplasmic adaptor subunit [Gammaproteobacteria bacterium]